MADSFANQVLGDWDAAMHQFFTKVEKRMVELNLTPADVETALGLGYGEGVADSWVEWVGRR